MISWFSKRQQNKIRKQAKKKKTPLIPESPIKGVNYAYLLHLGQCSTPKENKEFSFLYTKRPGYSSSHLNSK